VEKYHKRYFDEDFVEKANRHSVSKKDFEKARKNLTFRGITP
jgi:hypothetical protein